MKPKARFIKSVIETARTSDVKMPWARGARHVLPMSSHQQAAPMAQVKTA